MSDIPYYLELQRRLFETFRFVSCHENNFGTYSIMLESLLVDTCTFYDSLCQTFIRQTPAGHVFRDQGKVPGFAEKVANKAEFNFCDYRSLLEGEFELSRREVNLNRYEGALYFIPLQDRPEKGQGYPVRPYSEWATGHHSPWWRAFTGLKHNRLENLHHATLKNAVYSLAALFILLTLRDEANFKQGRVPAEIYELFLPLYWEFHGRVMPGIFTWR